MQKVTIDKLDRDIIAALSRDGRMSFREVARSVDVSEGTVRARVTRLQEHDLIRVTLVGYPLAMGVGMSVMITLRVKPGSVRATAEALAKFPNVRFVALSFGRADVSIQSLHKDIADLHHFVSEVIPKAAPAVTSIETFPLAEVVKSSWTWGDWFEYLESGAQSHAEAAPDAASSLNSDRTKP